MAKLVLVDCPTGLAGNMLLAALMDLGVPRSVVEQPLAVLGLAGAFQLVLEERRSGGLRGLHLQVRGCEPEPPHRRWIDLRLMLEQAPLEPGLRGKALAVFALLAEAEGRVHGHAPDQVHFHEVGAIDALVDVIGVCAGLLHLGVEELHCTPPPTGHGSVRTAHGLLPVPVPAVLELARRRALPLASSAGLAPAHVPLGLGVGVGSRQLDRPNLLRLVLGQPCDAATGQCPGPAGSGAPGLELVVQQQAQVDDATPEDLAVLLDALRNAGALDVFCQAISMKKGRPGWLVTALSQSGTPAVALREVWWRHATTLGVRESLQQRWVLQRRTVIQQTSLGPVRIKQALLPDGRWRSKLEHDDLITLAHRHGLALDQVRASVQRQIADPKPAGGQPSQP